MLKIVFYIVMAILVIYVTTYAVLFVVAAVMYRSGRITKVDLDKASKEYQQKKRMKKECRKNKKTARRLKRQTCDIDSIWEGGSTFMWQ